MDDGRHGDFKDMLCPASDGFLQAVRKHDPPIVSQLWNQQEADRALRPNNLDHHHQDSLFGNSFQAKSFFVVHPEWISEAVDNTDPEPLHRPPWPWEQPRYRQNIQTPITYKIDEPEPEVKEDEEGAKATPPPVQYALPIGYTFTHPSIDDAKPFAKRTQFGAPVVDTTHYKLSF